MPATARGRHAGRPPPQRRAAAPPTARRRPVAQPGVGQHVTGRAGEPRQRPPPSTATRSRARSSWSALCSAMRIDAPSAASSRTASITSRVPCGSSWASARRGPGGGVASPAARRSRRAAAGHPTGAPGRAPRGARCAGARAPLDALDELAPRHAQVRRPERHLLVDGRAVPGQLRDRVLEADAAPGPPARAWAGRSCPRRRPAAVP